MFLRERGVRGCRQYPELKPRPPAHTEHALFPLCQLSGFLFTMIEYSPFVSAGVFSLLPASHTCSCPPTSPLPILPTSEPNSSCIAKSFIFLSLPSFFFFFGGGWRVPRYESKACHTDIVIEAATQADYY